jgi:hypothetical protein
MIMYLIFTALKKIFSTRFGSEIVLLHATCDYQKLSYLSSFIVFFVATVCNTGL